MGINSKKQWMFFCNKCKTPVQIGLTKCPSCGSLLLTNKNDKIKKQLNKNKNTSVTLSSNIYLYTLDGFEFEELIGEIYRLNGFQVTDIKKVGDEGRDLIVEKSNERILIECKHQKGTVGRPVVQKLHSAVIVDSKAKRGIIITTGKFSQQAKIYANQSNVPISLMDLPEIRKLASRVNIKLLLKGEKMQNGFYPVEPENVTKNNVIKYMSYNLISYPNNLSRIIRFSSIKATFVPVYRLSYRVNHITRNSSGYILYEVKITNILHVQADNLVVHDALSTFLINSRIVNKPSEDRVVNVRPPTFLYDTKRIIDHTKKHLIKTHSKTVVYYGNNNVRYSKHCSISDNDVFISNLTPVYLALQEIKITILSKNYSFNLVENIGKPPLILKSSFKNCSICNNSIENVEKLLCNSCGSLAHTPNWWKRTSHSYKCDICGKTICRNCGYWKPKWLLMKTIYCSDCAALIKDVNKTPEKIPRLT